MRFYCEFHENIRTLHLSVTLPSTPNDLTTLEVYDRKTLRLRHAFQSYSISLPASVDPSEQLHIIINGLKLTCRIKAEAILSSTSRNDVPLHSLDTLKQDIKCKECRSTIIHGTRMKWSHMPSENWTEMMDSWHCHRGVSDEHHHEHHDQYALPDHIISAAERIRARPGRGLVGLSYLLVHESDVHLKKDTLAHHACQSCQRYQSMLDDDEHRLLKQDLVVAGEEVDPLTYLVAGMLDKLALQAVHHFLVTRKSSLETRHSDSNVLIWVLTPETRITATGICNNPPGRRVVKVMYRRNVNVEQGQQDTEQINADEDDFSRLVQRLDEHHRLVEQESFQDWSSSFIERFEVKDDFTSQ